MRAANNDGVWNDVGAALDVLVPPRFYQTGTFRASVVVLVVLIAAGLHHLRVRRMEAQFSLVMKERNRIAREIHDGLSQGLVAIGLHLSAMEGDRSDAGRERHVQKARQLVEANLGEARRSVWDLHPQYLDRHDLIAGLGRMAGDLGEDANVPIRIRASGSAYALSPEVEKNLFRIAQEAMANAIRHGAPDEITIEVRFDRHQMQITVADDGRGFDPTAASDRFGLTSMRERAAQIGATLRVDSRPGGGTRVTVAVPTAPVDRASAAGRVRALVSAIGRRVARR